MIIPEFNTIFVHCPRTGGNSIEFLFRQWLPDFVGRFRKHWTAREMQKVMGKAYYEKQFVFSFIRNPFSRFVSSYEFHDKREHTFEEFITITEQRKFFLDRDGMPHRLEVNPWNTGGNCPQHYMIHDERGKNIVDFVGRTETMNDDWSYICKKLNIAYQPVPRMNASNPLYADYRFYYKTSGLVDRVRKLYEEDLKAFGYEYEE